MIEAFWRYKPKRNIAHHHLIPTHDAGHQLYKILRQVSIVIFFSWYQKRISLSRSLRFAVASELCLRVKESWRSDGQKESEIISHFGNLGVLVIDEMGAQYNSQTDQKIIYDVINRRYQNQKSTKAIEEIRAIKATECADTEPMVSSAIEALKQAHDF